MGRPRKPTALKILDGDRKDRINLDEPKSPPGLADPPAWMGEVEREGWAILKARMGEMGVATRADEEAVGLYCSAYAMWREAKAALDRDGLTITDSVENSFTTKNGTRTTTKTTTRVHPMVKVVQESSRQMGRLLSQFGMTPSARSALHIESKQDGGALIQFLQSRAGKGKPR